MINSQILRGFVTVVSMVATCCTYFSHDVILLNTRMLEKSFFPFFAWDWVVRLSKKVSFPHLEVETYKPLQLLRTQRVGLWGKIFIFSPVDFCKATCQEVYSNLLGKEPDTHT